MKDKAVQTLKVLGGIIVAIYLVYDWWSNSKFKAVTDFDTYDTVCKLADTENHDCECKPLSSSERKMFKALLAKGVDGYRLEKWNAGYTYYVWKDPKNQIVNAVSFDEATCEMLRSDIIKKRQ